MRRFLLPLALVAGLVAVPNASAARYKIGISDQSAATFVHPLFAPLKLKMARYVAPWDVMNPGRVADNNNLINWVNHATATNQRILMAFEASHTPGKQKKIPSVKAYTRAMKRFKAAYPAIRDIQPWNEVNRCQATNETGYVTGQPICKKPKKAAGFYKAATKVFRGSKYKITGLDILDQANVKPAVRYVKKFLRAVKKMKAKKPKFWGFHNYSDTNRFSSKRTKALLKATKSGDVWLTETGGIVSLGKSFPYNPKRAAKALGCMFKLAKSNRRITRLYVYEFFGSHPGQLFDAGLINADDTKRPGYNVVKKRKARKCKK